MLALFTDKDIQSDHTKSPTVWLYAFATTQKERCCSKMPLYTISGQWVTDSVCQLIKIGLIRSIFVTNKESVGLLT